MPLDQILAAGDWQYQDKSRHCWKSKFEQTRSGRCYLGHDRDFGTLAVDLREHYSSFRMREESHEWRKATDGGYRDEAKKGHRLALKARVLKCCEYHEEVFEGDQGIVEAYKLANARFDKDSLGKIFDSRREMTGYIKEEVEDAAVECWQCAEIQD